LEARPLRHPLEGHLHLLERPGRYIGGEPNSIVKDDPSRLVRFALLYPETYELGMSNLGLRILYHVLNSDPRVQAERAFLPWLDAIEVHRREGIPLFTLETRTPLRETDALGVSMHTELNYTGLLLALDLSRIPLHSAERGESDPIVIVGGPCAFNPLPLSPFVDAFCVGDGEDVVLELIPALEARRNGELHRNDTLSALSEVRGVYVPAVHGTNTRVERRTADLEPETCPVSQILPHVDVVHNRFTLEILRGCTRGCRFCQAGFCYRPPRLRPPEEILDLAEAGLRETGYDEMSLLSFTTSDYPDLVELLIRLKERLGRRAFVSLPSLPVDAVDRKMLETFQDLRRFGITLAPETVAQGLRNAINKNVPLQDVFRAAELAQEFGWRHMKLYFMVGLPKETLEDAREIAGLLRELHESSRRIDFKVSLSPFVPRPHTPFQWERQWSPEEWMDVIGWLRSELRGLRRMRISWHAPEKSALEGVLARGDESLPDAILEAYRRGATFDDRSECFDFSTWERAFEAKGVDWRGSLAERDPKKQLPWSLVDPGVSRDFLLRELGRARAGRTTPDCMAKGCQGCGPFRDQGFPTCVDGLKVEMPPRSGARPLPEVEFQYLFEYEKTVDARWLSHLDVMRMLVSALRRAGYIPAYSKGFVPKPLLSLGPALLLGAEGRSEWFSVKGPRVDLGPLIELLNRELPGGIRILRGKDISGKPAWNDITRAMYTVSLERGIVPDDLETIRETATFERRTKRGNVKRIEAKDIIAGLSAVDGILRLELRLGTGIGPLDVLSKITGEEPEVCRGQRIVREELRTEAGPFGFPE
jgi:radical SAM family uncharacterized protein/radical SAM-linked protein